MDVDADLDLLNAVTGATGKPKTSEDYAQLVALAQKNIGFAKHAIDGQYGKNTRLLLNNRKLDDMKITSSRLSYIKKNIERRGKDIDIERDKTAELLDDQTNGFNADVKEFLAYLKANKKVENGKDVYPRNVPYDMIKRFVLKGNYGLVNLLIGVANFGILPGTLPKPLQSQDPFQYSDNASIRINAAAAPFQSVNIGKGPFDYDKGGIGIPHFDVHNIHELYVKFGLPDCELKDLYVNPKNVKKVPIGNIEIPYQVGDKAPKSKEFKFLVKLDNWVEWAEKLVNNDEAQAFMFKHWAEDYWLDNLNKYKAVKAERKGTPQENQHVAMQDLTLNSRIGNSMTSTSFVGLSPEQQAMVYIEFKNDDHVSRQLPNVQRVNLLIEYIVEHETGQQSNAQSSQTHATPAPKTPASSSDNHSTNSQTAYSEKDSSTDAGSAAIQAPALVTKALQNLNLLPDVQKDKLLNEEKEASAVNYNKKRTARVNEDIQRIAMAAFKPVPATDEDKAQTIAHAQKNLGLGTTNPDNIDGKYGKNTQRAVAGSANTPSIPMYADNKAQNVAPATVDDASHHKESAAQTEIADTEVESADITTAKDEYENNYKTLGLIPYSEAAFANVVNRFGQNADKATAIAQLIVWARLQKDPSIAFPIFQGGIYNNNKELIKRVTEAQNYEKQKQKAQNSASDIAPEDPNAPDSDVHAPNAAASEPDFSDVSPELMQAMIGKSDVKKTLRGDALFNAFKANDAEAFEAEKKNLLSAYYALQLYGIQCNEVSELMVRIAHGKDSEDSKFFANGFKGAIFRPRTEENPSLEDRYLPDDYEETRKNENLEAQLTKVSEGQKRTDYLEKFRNRLHGKGDPAWNDVKEGDFIIQFQGADLKKMKKNKDTKQEELDQGESYAEDQFRHVAVIVKIIHAQDLTFNQFKSVVTEKTINSLTPEERKKMTKEEIQIAEAKILESRKELEKRMNDYYKRAYKDNHRLACTMGASGSGVGINDTKWAAIPKNELNWSDNSRLLWHDLDEDWYGKGIIRSGTSANTSRIEKVYLFK